ncbi:unnamed protein product [Calicophoron daubneyi]|uniref:Uncharacterized protein n=1 Tax=Calicophoron daubneyi TaxID=300641 RepID=A0AAV2SZ88_CALDB
MLGSFAHLDRVYGGICCSQLGAPQAIHRKMWKLRRQATAPLKCAETLHVFGPVSILQSLQSQTIVLALWLLKDPEHHFVVTARDSSHHLSSCAGDIEEENEVRNVKEWDRRLCYLLAARGLNCG